jgi:thiol:disulfide interchange protein
MLKIETRFGLLALALSTLLAAPAHASGIAWRSSLDAGIKEAKKSGKPILVDFWATWCPGCVQMEKKTFPNKSVVSESKKWVMVRLNIESSEETIAKYKVGSSFPAILFLKPGGALVSKTTNFQSADALLKAMRANYSKARK